MSKMGISVISSYRGGCNFEAVGLSRAIVSDYFPGMSSRISGIELSELKKILKSCMINLIKKTFLLYLLVGFIGIEKVVKTTSTKVI